jgi:uncharacterized protein YdeI (YjbR/CyaY-like superfamily)
MKFLKMRKGKHKIYCEKCKRSVLIFAYRKKDLKSFCKKCVEELEE